MAFAGKGTVSGEMALDILEAYELIKEMRELFERLSCYNLDYNVIGKIDDVLERTKEYAE